MARRLACTGWVKGLILALAGIAAVVSAPHLASSRLGRMVQLGLTASLTAPQRAPRALPETAESFADSVGVVVHLVYADSSYANWPEVKQALQYLGVRRMREIAPLATNARIENVHAAAAAGYRFTFLVLGQLPLEASIAALTDFAKRHPGAIVAIEGPNEVNNFGFPYRGLTGDRAAQAFQSDLYRAVRRESALGGIPVYNLTSWPDLAGEADFANFHSYAHAGAQAKETLRGDMAREQSVMPGKPMVLTEAGYHNTIGAGLWEGVDEATAAPLTLNLLFDAWSAGVSEVDLYQLLDGYPDPGGQDMERHFGLFDVAYRPKPAATALRNLLSIMREHAAAGPALPPATVVSGPADLATLQLKRSDGAHIVVLYRRAKLWDAAAHKPLQVMVESASIRPPRGASGLVIYSPVSGTRREIGLAAADLTLQLGADPVVLVFLRRDAVKL